MRKCIRCQTETIENCGLRIEGAASSIVLTTDDDRLFGKRIGKPKVAICPNCGEISLYTDRLDDLKK